MKKDIENRKDIELLVDTFYGSVRKDPLLGGIFEGAIQDKWPEHLEKMYRFWETALMLGKSYSGSPFKPHARMPLEKIHFDRWLKLFRAAIHQHFEGPKAEEAKLKAENMAQMFLSKIEYYRNNPNLKIL